MNRILFHMEMRRNLRSLVIWTAVIGFYTANNLIYMMLMGSIFAIVLTSNILLKEEYGKTAEYLMSRPVTRHEIFITKTALAFLHIFLLNFAVAGIGFVACLVYKKGPFDVPAFLVISFYTLLLNLLFGALGLLFSVRIRRAHPITSFSVALVMVLYFLYTISRMSGIDGSFGYLSPFKWVNVDVLSPGYGLEFSRLVAFVGSITILVLISWFLYRRKDILT
jgi:ABC-2 type transport system permease protein